MGMSAYIPESKDFQKKKFLKIFRFFGLLRIQFNIYTTAFAFFSPPFANFVKTFFLLFFLSTFPILKLTKVKDLSIWKFCLFLPKKKCSLFILFKTDAWLINENA